MKLVEKKAKMIELLRGKYGEEFLAWKNEKKQISLKIIYLNEKDANELLIVQNLGLIWRKVVPI